MRQQTRPLKEPAEKVVHPAVEKLEIIQLVEQSHLPVRIRPCNDIEDAGIKPRDLEAVLPRRRHRARGGTDGGTVNPRTAAAIG